MDRAETREIVLGRSTRSRRTDRLRDGTLVIRSPHGLRAPERALIENLPARARRILSVLDADGVVALAARCLLSEAPVVHFELDAYLARRAREAAVRNALEIEFEVGPDLPTAGEPPGGGFDVVLLAGPEESLLLRELVEEAHDALEVGGRFLLAAERSPRSLQQLVKRVFGRADHQAGKRRDAHLIAARRAREKSARRDRERTIVRDVRGLSLSLVVRPGVFGYRGLDPGTRALIEALEIPRGARILDLGSGTGVLGVAAHALGAGAVTFVDKSARACALSERNARRNRIEAFEVLLRAELEDLGGPYDVVLVNPPYFSNFRIAEALIEAGHRALAEGGALWLVAKAEARHLELVRARFDNGEVISSTRYGVIRAEKPPHSGFPTPRS